MKKLISLLLVVFCGVQGMAQEKFIFNRNGFTDFIVVQTPGKTKGELYQKTLEWVQVTYNNPKEVIKGQIENEYIRISGVFKLCQNVLGPICDNAFFQIEISFKDDKYKFDVISLGTYYKGSLYPIIDNPSRYYKDNGEIRKQFSLYPETIENIFNSLNNSLKFSIMNETPKNDW